MMVRKVITSKPRRPRRKAAKAPQEQILRSIAAIDGLEPASPKAAKVLSLLRSWLADESGYDEETWPRFRKALVQERARRGSRRLFNT